MIQTAIKVVKDSSGGTYPALLGLPDDYSKTTNNYPVLVFCHGQGEGGSDLSKIYTSSTAGGPAYFIEQGKWPSSFTIGSNSFKFIVVSPQSNNGWSTTAQELDFILTDLIKNYRVDQSRIYLTGLSAGGEGILEYVGGITGTGIPINKNHKIAAFIPVSAVMNAALTAGYASQIIKDNVQIWGFGSPSDTHGANTLQLITWYIGNLKKGYGIGTSYIGGHCCWGQFYDPSFIQNGLNIYQWALQYTSSVAQVPPVVVTPPPVVVPPPVVLKTITKVVVYYSDGTNATLP